MKPFGHPFLQRIARLLRPRGAKPLHLPSVIVPQAPAVGDDWRGRMFPPFDPAAVDLAPLTPALARRIASGHANEAAAQLRRLDRAGLAGPEDHQLLVALDRWAAGDLT